VFEHQLGGRWRETPTKEYEVPSPLLR
jgi:hypothetical protein